MTRRPADYASRQRTLRRTGSTAGPVVLDGEADPWKGFYAGCRAFLEVSLDPEVQRITLLDAPAVLGWDLMREIEEDYSMAPLERRLEIAITSGRIAPRRCARQPTCSSARSAKAR